jgi:peptidoglycan/LPS O-acetylase OafA/YrhL
MSKTKWFSGIDSLRFVLALIVVLGHLKSPLVPFLESSNLAPVRYLGTFLGISFVGVAAVICFFIISGFVIHYPNKSGISNLKNFYYRRYIRVLLPLVIIMLGSIRLHNPERLVVWSLYCELVYYTLYPLLAAIKLSWRSKLIGAFFLATIAILVGAFDDIGYIFNKQDFDYDGSYWQLGVGFTWIIGLPCWLLGVQLAQKIDDVKTVVSRWKIYAFRMAIFSASIVVLFANFHFSVTYLLSLTILSIPMCKWIEYEIQYFKTHKPVALLEKWGKFSYSLYLTHPLALVLIPYFMKLNIYTYLIYIGLAIVIAYFFYLVLERPSHLLAQRMSRKKPILSSVTAVAFTPSEETISNVTK